MRTRHSDVITMVTCLFVLFVMFVMFAWFELSKREMSPAIGLRVPPRSRGMIDLRQLTAWNTVA